MSTTDLADIRPGVRVRLARTWHGTYRAGNNDVRIEGTVAEFTLLGPGSGAVLLTDVPVGDEGWWAAPVANDQQTTTLERL